MLDLDDPFSVLRARVASLRACRPTGRLTAIDAQCLTVEGLSSHLSLGDEIVIPGETPIRAEVLHLDERHLKAVPFATSRTLRLGQAVEAAGPATIAPHPGWIGRVVDPLGRPLDGRPLPQGTPRPLTAPPPSAAHRRGMGARLHTGHAVLDTMLPIVRGQRVGLFAGSGVGKSTLLGALASGMESDVCVLALVGERGREVGNFVRDVLGPHGMARTVVIAATSDMPAPLRRRCALAAMAVAESMRDAGRQVLFLCDSVTRLAEAHREMASGWGEGGAIRGHPASLTPLLASLCERAGPGESAGQGDITAVFSVLVAGSDMEEPVADILRGQLDGHIVLSRDIAEAGRFPAVDVLRSVSRSLPAAADAPQNALIAEARRLLGVEDDAALMVSSGLYEKGASAEIDRAVMIVPKLEDLFGETSTASIPAAFTKLAAILGRPDPALMAR